MDDATVDQLVSKVLNSGCTPEDACRDSPALLPEVREQLRLIRSVDLHVDAVFPAALSALPSEAQPWRSLESLPHVPGHEVLSVLGHGGMGVVYAARHVRLNRTVAVKMLLSGAHTDAASLKRLLREAESVAALSHPNIVQVHEVGEHDGLPYFTMELVEGGSLREKLAEHVLDSREAAALSSTLADAVAAAHAHGIIHRDLKPANVLLTHDGVPKIADFGLARRIDVESSLTLADARLGTPSYMSPEQAQGGSRAIGPATDVYALGAILYAMVTGRPPFRSDVCAVTLRQVIEDEPVRPSRLNPRVPRDLETICLKCLSKDPERRYASAVALAEDLQRFLRGEPIVARPVGFLARAAKWARRRPAHATIAAGSVLAVLAVAGVGLWLGIQRGEVERTAAEDLLVFDREAGAENWPAARTALEKAKARLMRGSFADLSARVAEGQRDLSLAEKLDAIRERQIARDSAKLEVSLDAPEAEAAYEAVFLELGLADVPGRPREVAAQIQSSRIRSVLVSALDSWAIYASGDAARRDGLLEAVRLADPDPTGWRDRVRDPSIWNDSRALAELTSTASVSMKSVLLLLTLAEHVVRAGDDAGPFLERIQSEYPGDYWANATLGSRLAQRAPEAAVRYYQAAAALRPGSGIARGNLGIVLATSGRLEEATAHLRSAVVLDPANAPVHVALSTCLQWKGAYAEGIEELRAAMRMDPLMTSSLLARTSEALREALETDSLAQAHESVGHVFARMGKLDDAIACMRESIRLDSGRVAPKAELVRLLIARGRFDEARVEAKLFLESHPADAPGRKGAQVLFDHCERVGVLAADLPAILDGTRAPQDGGECLAFADLCRARQEHAKAARYFGDAFDRGVGTPVKDPNWRTYDAARCAALAAGAATGDEERAEWRTLAYSWLRLELGALHGVLEKNAREYGRAVCRSLEDWWRDPDLAVVRGDEVFARLPQDEQAKWRKLWSAAGTLTARAKKAVR